MTDEASILRLSNEILRLILDFIEPDPEKTVPIDRRQFLSVESFDRPLPSSRGSIKDIGSFRRACRRFTDVGEPLLFTRVAARFSNGGLDKLEWLASQKHLCRHVKKFSYLVPYFYRQDHRSLLRQEERTNVEVHARLLQRKRAEQQEIVTSKKDLRILKRAIASFTSLQFIQLLRVTDEEDERLLTVIRHHENLRPFIEQEWATACSHSSQTIGAALLSADVPWSRFSSPMLSPQSAGFLAENRPESVSTLAARLTCLTLHFDDGTDLDQKMSDLSALFRIVFTTAVHMQAVHLGFPSHRPLSLPLEDVFHDVVWEKLVAFGIQGWKLDAEEILNLALRHRGRLKGLRLRDVYLKDGSLWKEVLGSLKESMHRLEWVSLRRIGYVRHFDEEFQTQGAEVPDDPPPGDSDSESDEDEDEPLAGPSNYSQNFTHHASGEYNDYNDEDDLNDLNDSDDGRRSEADEMDFPALSSPVTPASAPWCSCDGHDHLEKANALDDNGSPISNIKRKQWERWVVRRCPEHDER